MEKNELRQLPPEIWSYILTSIEDFDDIIKLKFVNTLFYQELNSRDPFNAFDRSIKLSKGKKENNYSDRHRSWRNLITSICN